MNYPRIDENGLSADYQCLVERMAAGEAIACVVDHASACHHEPLRDIAVARHHPTEGVWLAGCRGVSYLYAMDKADFIQQCYKTNLRFFPKQAVESC